MKLIDMLTGVRSAIAAHAGVIESLHIHYVGGPFAPASIHCQRHRPGGIKIACQTLHSGHNARAPGTALLPLLISQ